MRLCHPVVAAASDTLSSPALRGFLRDLAAHPRCNGRPMQAFLQEPVKQVSRYRLVFDELNVLTPDSHPDKLFMQEAATVVQQTASTLMDGSTENSPRRPTVGIVTFAGAFAP